MTSHKQPLGYTDEGRASRPAADRATRASTEPFGLGPDGRVSTDAARFYIDCEFDGHNGPLLSFGVATDGERDLHYRVTDAPPVNDPWVAESVVPLMGRHCARLNYSGPLNALGPILRKFIEPCERPLIIADSPVDIGRFCAAISTGTDGAWASADFPLMRFEVHNVDCWPNDIVGGVQHNAWWDAMALRHKLTRVQS